MRLPNKTIPFERSIFVYFPLIIKEIQNGNVLLDSIYFALKYPNKTMADYLDALVCLYAIGKVYMNEEGQLELC